MLVPGLLLWASFVMLLYISDWVPYGLTARTPSGQRAEALIRACEDVIIKRSG